MVELAVALVARLVLVGRAEVELRSLEGRLVVLLVSFGRAGSIPLSALGSWSVGGYPWQPPLVVMGVTLSPIPRTLGLSLLEEAPSCEAPWVQLQQQGPSDSPHLSSLGRPPPEDLLISE